MLVWGQKKRLTDLPALRDAAIALLAWRALQVPWAPDMPCPANSTDAGAGKRRLFAIGNYSVRPKVPSFCSLHDFLMELLKRIPQDGTLNQTRPLDMLLGHREVFSFDLKSATDRSFTSIENARGSL